jgi:hypothetical protein
MRHIHSLTTANFKVQSLIADNEFDVHTEKMNENGILINPAGAGKHVPQIEKQVKERVRCHLHALIYKLPSKLMKWLV